MQKLFSPKDVARLIGISYRQIQYWDSSGFIRPSVRRRGRFRFYAFADLILLRVAKELRAQGTSIQRLRKIIASLRRLVERRQEDLETMTFLLDGESILVFTGEVVMDHGSERSFYQFRVPELVREVREAFVDEDETDAARDEAV